MNLILVGLVFELLDFRLFLRVGARIASADVLPDAVGTLLTTIGICLLAFRDYFEGFVETALLVATGFAIGASLLNFVPWLLPSLALPLWFVECLRAGWGIAILIVCFAMCSLVVKLDLEHLAKRWGFAGVAYVLLQGYWGLVRLSFLFSPPPPMLWPIYMVVLPSIPLGLFVWAVVETRKAGHGALRLIPPSETV